MLTALTILSLDQGKMYSPPPDRFDEPTGAETTADMREPQAAGIHNLWPKAIPWTPVAGLLQFLNRLSTPGAAP